LRVKLYTYYRSQASFRVPRRGVERIRTPATVEIALSVLRDAPRLRRVAPQHEDIGVGNKKISSS
jgi:hypothetical protein